MKVNEACNRRNVAPGDVLSLCDREHFMAQSCTCYDLGDKPCTRIFDWSEHSYLLVNGDVISLTIVHDAYQIIGDTGELLEHNGVRYFLVGDGKSRYRSVDQAELETSGDVAYAIYARGEDYFLLESYGNGPQWASCGRILPYPTIAVNRSRS